MDPKTKVKSAVYPVPSDEVGVDPWHYLYGTVKRQTTKDALDERYENYYKGQGYTRAEYDKLTADWAETDYATDCQGLLDAYMTYELGEKTDINANMNYKYWCEDKGEISKISRPYVIGEAVFMQNSLSGKMIHVGWVCGFIDSGIPLVMEARGIKYGVVITKLSERSWTHRGLMTVQFDYSEPQAEPIKLELTDPMMQGEYVLLMQRALNALHYTDPSGWPLKEDGKCGPVTMYAVTNFAKAHAGITEPEEIFYGANGHFRLVLEKEVN